MADFKDMEAPTNLDQDLLALRYSKYKNPQLQGDVRQWLVAVLGASSVQYDDLLVFLKDGTKLCEIVNAIWGEGSIKYKRSQLAFVQMENIDKFLTFCKSRGLPQDELFQTIDLYEAKDPYQILMSLQSLSRLAHTEFPRIPLIGPSVAKKRPPVPHKPQKYTLGQGGVPWSAMEYGYMNGANQATEGIVFGGYKKFDRS